MPASELRDGREGPAVVKVYEDGPYLIRGDFEIQDHDGELIASRRRTVALCRCGRSKLRPYCDGTHRLIRFQAPGTMEAPPSGQPSEVMLDGAVAERVLEEPQQILAEVTHAHRRVREAAPDLSHGAFRHAEPLLNAAEALLRWQLEPGATPVDAPTHDEAHSATPLDAVRSARVSAVRLELGDPQVADQIRSLLRDAARALQATSPPTTGDAP